MVKKFRNEQMKPNEQDAYCVGIKPLQMFLFLSPFLYGGYFQYPNVFALFFLAGVIILVGDGRWGLEKCNVRVVWQGKSARKCGQDGQEWCSRQNQQSRKGNRVRFAGRFVCLIALLFGIMLSGSRTVFFLLVVVMLVFVIALREKRIRWTLCGLLGAVVVMTVVYAVVTGNMSAWGCTWKMGTWRVPNIARGG